MGQNLRRVYVEAIPMAAVLLARRWKASAAEVRQVLARTAADSIRMRRWSPMPVEPELSEFEFVSSVPLLARRSLVCARSGTVWLRAGLYATWLEQQEAFNRALSASDRGAGGA